MQLQKFILLIGFSFTSLFSTYTLAEPAAEFDSLANAVLLVHEECQGIHDVGTSSFNYPPNVDVTLAQCQDKNGILCWARDASMGGWISSEIICTHNQRVIGGLQGTYSQSQSSSF
jgi:hypothetical protein